MVFSSGPVDGFSDGVVGSGGGHRSGPGTGDTAPSGGVLRSRHAAAVGGKHRGTDAPENFARGFAALGDLALNGVQVSARATDLSTGRVLFSVDDHVSMPTGSIGKVLLLIEVAARLKDAEFGVATMLERTSFGSNCLL